MTQKNSQKREESETKKTRADIDVSAHPRGISKPVS
jgi:hypothetical protein